MSALTQVIQSFNNKQISWKQSFCFGCTQMLAVDGDETCMFTSDQPT